METFSLVLVSTLVGVFVQGEYSYDGIDAESADSDSSKGTTCADVSAERDAPLSLCIKNCVANCSFGKSASGQTGLHVKSQSSEDSENSNSKSFEDLDFTEDSNLSKDSDSSMNVESPSKGDTMNTRDSIVLDDTRHFWLKQCVCSCLSQDEEPVSREESVDADGQTRVSASDNASEIDSSYEDCVCSNEMPTERSGYTYTIEIQRRSLITSNNDVVYADMIDERNQPITYYKLVDAENPFWIDGWLTYNRTDEIYTIDGKESVSACDVYESGTWQKVLVDIVVTQLMPNESCPVQPGIYTMKRSFQITETFNEMINCGYYNTILYGVNALGQWAFQFYFEWTIPDDGTCIAQNSDNI